MAGERGKNDQCTLAQIGEEAIVSRLVSRIVPHPGVLVGPGDDCAVVRGENGVCRLLKTDSIVEGVHFLPSTEPVRVGRKAMNRAISDIAAMGGLPDYALVSLASDPDRPAVEVEGWFAGIAAAAAAAGCTVVGGETSSLPATGAVITISLQGHVEEGRCILRSGASPGDVIAVTGWLGGSFASGRHLDFVPRLREARWLAEHARPTAMMDLSDGLGSDLPRLAAASGVGYRIDPSALPLHEGVAAADAIAEGEDYELLLAFSPETFARLAGSWNEAFPDIPLTKIGEISETTDEPLPRAWEHYRSK